VISDENSESECGEASASHQGSSSPGYSSSEHDSDNSDFHHGVDDNQPLCEGCKKTTNEVVLEVCQLFLKHRWTKASINDTLKVISCTLPEDNNMPQSLHMLYKYVSASTAP